MTGGINGGKNLKIGNQESCREAVSCTFLIIAAIVKRGLVMI
jgi:hypothetical protein